MQLQGSKAGLGHLPAPPPAGGGLLVQYYPAGGAGSPPAPTEAPQHSRDLLSILLCECQEDTTPHSLDVPPGGRYTELSDMQHQKGGAGRGNAGEAVHSKRSPLQKISHRLSKVGHLSGNSAVLYSLCSAIG
jgi:hypothetical protein